MVTEARDFVWTRRTRGWWIFRQGGQFRKADLHLPPKRSAKFKHDQIALHYEGKNLPKQIHFEDQYKLFWECGGQAGPATFSWPGLFMFTKSFPQPSDRCSSASKQAVQRFNEDGRNFPPMADEEGTLLRKSSARRVPTSFSKAKVHLIPEKIIGALPRYLKKSPAQCEATRASLVGNSSHIPSAALILFILLADLAKAEPIYPCIYAADEHY